VRPAADTAPRNAATAPALRRLNTGAVPHTRRTAPHYL